MEGGSYEIEWVSIQPPPTPPPTPPTPPTPTPCPTPAITSVSPDIWFAGKTYDNVIIEGTGFTSTATCPAPPVNVTAADGSAVPVANVTIDSTTQITATIAPPASGANETACVTVGQETIAIGAIPVGPHALVSAASNATPTTGAGSPCTDSNGNNELTGITVQILGAPKILCSGDGMQCNGKRISVINGDDPTPQDAVVGQKIKLITKPKAEELSALGLSFSKNTWTAGPASGPSNNVGGYTMTVTKTTASTKITKTKLDKPDLTTYWLYPQSDNPLTYQYCVDIPGLSTDDIANGLNCSLVAKATFNVSGPTATIEPKPKAWHVSRPIPVSNSTGKEQMLTFGKIDPLTSTTRNLVVEIPGMTFTATVNVVPGSSGQTAWVQVLGPINNTTGTGGGGQPIPSTNHIGLDSTLPYNDTPIPVDATTAETNDSPGTPLDINWDTATRAFNAKMYLMWQSQIPDSIPVSLGYVEWAISGTATAVEGNTLLWSLTSSGPTSKHPHVGADDGTKTHGLPKFSQLVVKDTDAVKDENETEANEEEEQ
jgi:hypothetical protein